MSNNSEKRFADIPSYLNWLMEKASSDLESMIPANGNFAEVYTRWKTIRSIVSVCQELLESDTPPEETQ